MKLKEKKYFVTGIGTNVGKTVAAAVLVNALEADYWKPVQCGNLEYSDSDFIKNNSNAHVFPERFRFALPASPHAAAENEKTKIGLNDFSLPQTNKTLIVEGAGGMLVPLNDKNDYVIDLAVKFNLPLIIVSSFYLGSINHTLLTLEYAKSQNCRVALLLFNGTVAHSSLGAIRKFAPDINTAFIPHLNSIDRNSISEAADNFKNQYLL